MKIRMRGIKRRDAVNNETVASVTVFNVDKKLSEVLSDVHKAIDKFYVVKKHVNNKAISIEDIAIIKKKMEVQDERMIQSVFLGTVTKDDLRHLGQYGAEGYDNQSLQSLSGFTGHSSQSTVNMMHGRGV